MNYNEHATLDITSKNGKQSFTTTLKVVKSSAYAYGNGTSVDVEIVDNNTGANISEYSDNVFDTRYYDGTFYDFIADYIQYHVDNKRFNVKVLEPADYYSKQA